MTAALWTFVPVAVLLTLTPGPSTALVARAKRSLASSRLAKRVEQLTGAVLLAVAGRLALESR